MQMGSLATIREADLPSARPESLRPDRLDLDAEVDGLITALRGGGQPVIKVRGEMFDASNERVFIYEAKRSGEKASARLVGVFMSDEEKAAVGQ